MGKNWLIRTKSNHILGPVSKEKVLELYQNGSIKPDDEICSGNGYWFFIRESDLVEKYLVGREAQTFNPISEAKDVLTSSDADPQLAPAREHITRVGALSLTTIQNGNEKTMQATVDVARKKKLKINSQEKYSGIAKGPEKQSWVMYVGVIIFLLLFSIMYYRKSILKTFFEASVTFPDAESLLISGAHAQDESPGKKKSS